jgi:hypothetical protein
MERLVSIDVDLIMFIIGLPSNGKKPSKYMDEKTKDRDLMEEMKKTHRK